MDKEKLNNEEGTIEGAEEKVNEKADKTPEIDQAERDRIASKAVEAYKRGEQDRIEKQVRLALEEAERQAKMSEEELQEEARLKALKELEEREALIKQRETELLAAGKLNEAGLSQEFLDFVVDEDEESIVNRIETLKEHINSQVETTVKTSLQSEKKLKQSKEPEVDDITKILMGK